MKKICVLTAMTALAFPLMALGQTNDQQQNTTQGQTNQNEMTAPAKGKKMRNGQESAKPQSKIQTGTESNVKGRAQEINRNRAMHPTTGQTNVQGTSQMTTVNKDEFRTRHSEMFSLGRHPKEFYVHRYGANHVRLIGNTYFAFVDGCWVSVDVDGFVYSQRVICPGDPDFIEVD
jgi:hypothetical protein